MSADGSQSGWDQLVDELDLWRRQGAAATFWWRDDDAVEVTPQLETLLRCSGGVPLALAVIPGKAVPALADRIGSLDGVTVFQHGWLHESHLAGGLSEYPEHRSTDAVRAELIVGRERLHALFQDQFLPVFVPPWHGFADKFLGVLPECGISAISRKGPRASVTAAPGLFQANAHVSPIKWTEPASFENDDHYLALALDHLQKRRTGACDREEATGLLTHHLAQDAESFAFVARFAEIVSDHPGAVWLDARQIFAAPSESADHQ